MPIPKITLPQSTLTLPRVLTGLWQVADMERDGKQVDINALAHSMKAYTTAGLTAFDMADHYGSAEDISGEYSRSFSKEWPAQFFTKWVPKPGPVTRDSVRAAIDISRTRLACNAIDLLQFHAWNYADPAWLDALFILQELKTEGIIKHIGVTNFDTAHLRVAVKSGIEIETNQVCFSLLDQRAAGEMSKLCLESGVRLLAFGTVAGGFLSNRWLNKPEPKLNESLTWSQMKYKRFIDAAGGWAKFQSLLKTLDGIAQQKNSSIANLATRFMLEQPAVAAVIVGARLGESEHIEDTLKTLSFDFSETEKSRVAREISSLTPLPGDCGDEYRKPPFLTASGDLSHHIDALPPPYAVHQVNDRLKVLSGTTWEDLAGYSRATRKGNTITVSGTTATHGQKLIGGNDPAAQTHFIIDKIEGAIQSLGGKLEDVVRTRIFVRHIDDWEAVARAHGSRFRDIQPANTLVKAELVGEEYLVEIEADAILN
jgi:aryl-alcohol dehydrogenase-like predicted oxidoreductase/enamine deaminase RidA (YjgF/YER057c/UK114 family)